MDGDEMWKNLALGPQHCKLILLVVLLTSTIAYTQQFSSDLQIISPLQGSVFAPGDTVSVTVSLASGSSFVRIGTIGENIGFSSSKATPPYTFVLTVPNISTGAKK